MDRQLLEKILTIAVQAPSGDNSQPWRFTYDGEALTIHVQPEMDHAILNVHNGGTLIALGALLHNLEIAAGSNGYKVCERDSTETTVTVVFQTTDTLIESTILQACLDRHTNRKTYGQKPLPAEVVAEIFDSNTTPDSKIKTSYLTDPKDIETLAEIASITESIALETKELHKLFFEGIFWDKTANEAGKPGLFIDTLELPPPARLMFKVLRYWRVVSWLRAIHFAKTAANANKDVYASAPLFGVIHASNDDRDSFIETGKQFESIWIGATKHSLGLQPLAGTLYLIRYIELYPEQTIIAPGHVDQLKKAATTLRTIFNTNAIPTMMFRMGYTQPATAVSGRKVLNIEYT